MGFVVSTVDFNMIVPRLQPHLPLGFVGPAYDTSVVVFRRGMHVTHSYRHNVQVHVTSVRCDERIVTIRRLSFAN